MTRIKSTYETSLEELRRHNKFKFCLAVGITEGDQVGLATAALPGKGTQSEHVLNARLLLNAALEKLAVEFDEGGKPK